MEMLENYLTEVDPLTSITYLCSLGSIASYSVCVYTFDIDWSFVNLTLDSYCPKLCDCRLLPRMNQLPPDPAATGNEPSSAPPPTSKQPHPIFEFRDEDYVNTVVTPTYRNLDQPPHYYVAEIRYDRCVLFLLLTRKFFRWCNADYGYCFFLAFP
ncbi:unnamed protein product [Dibothriocephalus latus]|uniref:Uncharacterized protein n=1 Tax=Dibothriocephalus latus TaxID=60516 RepID=A0A3P7N1H1_DIBLA|nr:unnamed protein product [Dibothriocephalus latus]